MNKPKILQLEDIKRKLEKMSGWGFADNHISKEFKFKNYSDSLNFVNQLTPFFESNDHHPDVHIMYNRIIFELQRFDVGGKVTDKDFDTAKEIERQYNNQ